MATISHDFRLTTGTGNLLQDGDFPKMLKIPIMEEEPKKKLTTTKYIISDTVGLDGAELIPIDLGGHLVPPTISINKLGKQLLKAAGEGDVEEIKHLMSKGAPFTADWLGTSPLHLAAQNNHIEVCEILLRAGISRDARTKVDRTPLHMAAYEGHLEIVEILLRSGADCDSRDLLYMTPLHWAAQNGHAEVVLTLVRYGASTNLVNKFELTPSDIAAQIKRLDIVDIINIQIRDPEIATRHITVDNSSDSDTNIDQMRENIEALSNSPIIPLETVLQEDSENSIDPETLHINHAEPELNTNQESIDNSFSESFKLLQQHGITMLPTDDSNILSSVMENGHSVVLTEIGKEVLNSVKPLEVQEMNIPTVKTIKLNNTKKKFISLNAQGLLTVTCNGIQTQGHLLRQINGKLINTNRPNFRKIVMTKNKINKVAKGKPGSTDMETVMKQLIEARKLVEEYKQKLVKKEAEAECYKQQLKILLESKT